MCIIIFHNDQFQPNNCVFFQRFMTWLQSIGSLLTWKMEWQLSLMVSATQIVLGYLNCKNCCKFCRQKWQSSASASLWTLKLVKKIRQYVCNIQWCLSSCYRISKGFVPCWPQWMHWMGQTRMVGNRKWTFRRHLPGLRYANQMSYQIS